MYSGTVVMVHSNCIKNSTEAMRFSVCADKIRKEQLVSPPRYLQFFVRECLIRQLFVSLHLNTKSRCLVVVIIIISIKYCIKVKK